MELTKKRLLAAALIVSSVAFPGVLAAQARRGANVVVTLRDMSQVAGELIAVKPDSLLLVSFVGKDESIPLTDIEYIMTKGKRKGGAGFGIGFLVGGIAGGVFAAHQIREHLTEMPTLTAIVSPLLAGSLTGLVGLAIGSASRSNDTIQIAGVPEEDLAKALASLRKKARVSGLP